MVLKNQSCSSTKHLNLHKHSRVSFCGINVYTDRYWCFGGNKIICILLVWNTLMHYCKCFPFKNMFWRPLHLIDSIFMQNKYHYEREKHSCLIWHIECMVSFIPSFKLFCSLWRVTQQMFTDMHSISKPIKLVNENSCWIGRKHFLNGGWIQHVHSKEFVCNLCRGVVKV